MNDLHWKVQFCATTVSLITTADKMALGCNLGGY